MSYPQPTSYCDPASAERNRLLRQPRRGGNGRGQRELVGTEELLRARHDPKFAQWEIGLPNSGMFHLLIAGQLARRGFKAAAGNEVVLEAAKAFVIRQRLGGWAIKFLAVGKLYFSQLDVSQAMANFVRSTEGRRHLSNAPLEILEEEALPLHPSAASITGRPGLPPDVQLLAKEFLQLLSQNRAALLPREQQLFDLLQTHEPFTNERGEALRQFCRRHGISTIPGSVHRWIRKLRRKLLKDVRLREILADYIQNRSAQTSIMLPEAGAWRQSPVAQAA